MQALKQLTPDLAVTGQILPAEVADLAGRGFAMIVCDRPDGEDPGQPDFAAIAAAAAAAGLEARHIPIASPAAADAAVVGAFAKALSEAKGPVLAYCRTGNRCAVLWALGLAGTKSADDIIGTAAAAGCDLSGLRPRLA
ncbi:TIGR01244 family sulfur transferase [Zavarzinia aquatilis]|uniref:TIGR01244 family phosphatase n=1 Tax=Zavarzinia aquatilis TaxID=2211142 RepID=A0A317ED17_9PROT|nr:TIGR01244 family sulfur transferase [Zavarzinia aquatilis]PWR24927.1 TIGR01244 family phosphatase [Zavarzinia aquatilis]